MSTSLLFDNAPIAMKALRQWVLWRLDPKRGKVPVQASGSPAATDDPSTWSSFSEVVAAYLANPGKYAGIRFVFTSNDPYAGVDFDGCLVGGEVAPWAKDWIDELGGYAEVSPSGNGIKVIVVGSFDGPGKKWTKPDRSHEGVEIYCRGRFFTITGDVLSRPPGEIPDRQDVVDRLHAFVVAHIAADKAARRATIPAPAPAVARKAGSPMSANRPDAERRASLWLEKAEPSISGQGGHDQAFYVACTLVHAFGLGVDGARPLYQGWNQTCQPPWSEHELEHKLNSAVTAAHKEPFGWKLDENREGWTPTAGRAFAPTEAPVDVTSLGESQDQRPRIEVGCEQEEVNTQAIAALARNPELFAVGDRLAIVAKLPPPRGVKDSPDGFKRICPLDLAGLEEQMSSSAVWFKIRVDKNGEVHETRVLPPVWSVKQIFSRAHKPGIPQVEGIVEAPILRPDGSIHDKPGYDPETWTFFSPNAEFLPVPEAPTKDDAIKAKNVLLELVVDFPFKDDANKAVWLAAALTPIARPAITEACPAFIFDAPEAGTGKSKLCDLISIIASGTEMPRTPWPGGRDVDDEVRKTITAIALGGDRFTLWDNVPEGHKFGCASLDNAITSATWKARILGSSKQTDALPWRAIQFATGNNMQLNGDTDRRALVSRIEADVERPCDREGFRFPKLISHAKANRPVYVQAALTILKAHALARRPQCARELGSFEEWSTVVASAVAWVMGVDPISVQKNGADRAPAISERKILFDGLLEVCNDTKEHTAADLLVLAEKLVDKNKPELGHLHPNLFEFTEPFLDIPSKATAKRKLFAALAKEEGKVVGKHKLTMRSGHANSKLWHLQAVGNCDTKPKSPSDESQMVSTVTTVSYSRRSHARENSICEQNAFPPEPAGGEAHHAHRNHHTTNVAWPASPQSAMPPTPPVPSHPSQPVNASGLEYDPDDWTTWP